VCSPFQSPYSVRLDLLSSPLGSRYIIVSAGSLACLVVVHLKHAHALILALALALALASGPRPLLVSSCTHLTLLPYLPLPAYARRKEAYISIHIHAHPYPSLSPRLLLHPRAAPVTIPIQEPCSLRYPLSHTAPGPSRRRTGLCVALTLPPIALAIVCSHCRPRPNVPVLYCCCCRRCVSATRRPQHSTAQHVDAMADEKHQPAFQSSPSMTWGRSPHVYPHSHHGTPAQEYSTFHFPSPNLSIGTSTFENAMPQRPVHQQLQPLVMPQWPSMLNSHPSQPYQPAYPQPVQPIQPMTLAPLPTPISATSSRSGSTPRKTLTDLDRKQMCQYAEENPTAKQTEIGGMSFVSLSSLWTPANHRTARFGVERRYGGLMSSR
jgi:hypothetical protein